MKALAILMLFLPWAPSGAEEPVVPGIPSSPAIPLRPAHKDISIKLQESKEHPDHFQLVITNASALAVKYTGYSGGNSLAGYCFEILKDGKWTAENSPAWCGVGLVETDLPPGQSKTLPIVSPRLDPLTKTRRSPGGIRVRLLLREDGQLVHATSPVYSLADGPLKVAPPSENGSR